MDNCNVMHKTRIGLDTIADWIYTCWDEKQKPLLPGQTAGERLAWVTGDGARHI